MNTVHPSIERAASSAQSRVDEKIQEAEQFVRLMERANEIDVNNTSSLLQRIRTLQSNNTFWAFECEKLHTLGWYKLGFIVLCALNLVLIFGYIAIGWWIWLR